MQDVKACPREMECLKEVNPDLSQCLPNCEGFLAASYIRTESSSDATLAAGDLVKQYGNYKRNTVVFASTIKSKDTIY